METCIFSVNITLMTSCMCLLVYVFISTWEVPIRPIAYRIIMFTTTDPIFLSSNEIFWITFKNIYSLHEQNSVKGYLELEH